MFLIHQLNEYPLSSLDFIAIMFIGETRLK